jgi:hypothetical protein
LKLIAIFFLNQGIQSFTDAVQTLVTESVPEVGLTSDPTERQLQAFALIDAPRLRLPGRLIPPMAGGEGHTLKPEVKGTANPPENRRSFLTRHLIIVRAPKREYRGGAMYFNPAGKPVSVRFTPKSFLLLHR